VCSQGAHGTKLNCSARRRRTRVCAHGRHAGAHDDTRKKHRAEQQAARVSMKAAAPVRNDFHILARWPASHSACAAAFWDTATSAQGSTRDLDLKVRCHKRWEETRCSPTAKKGPDSEGVGVEGLDTVAVWCSKTEEGGRRGRRPSLVPPSRTAPARRRRRATTDGQPRLLLLLHTSYVSGGGLGKGEPQLARV
jgi:hypothetical protein